MVYKLQAFGFSTVLAGLLYYSIGHDGVVVYYSKLQDFKGVFFKMLVYFLFSL